MKLTSKQLWNLILERLEQQLSRPTFDTWIKTSKIKEFKNNCLTIATPNPFILNHLQKNYIQILSLVVEEIAGQQVEIKLTTDRGENISLIGKSEPFTLENNQQQEIERKKSNISGGLYSYNLKPAKLNPKYTFNRFVVGPTNRMAHAASLAVAESLGKDFNPLFLCGGVGLGKTHLMQAIGHYRLEIAPNSRIFYVSCEQFTNDLISAIRKDTMQRFREHYRAADILLIDDIQFIEGKEYTQEEFFHTFNTLHESGKQVVLASDRPPNKIPTLQERLISRFSMGLIADIQVPDLETRIAILQKKAEYENISLPRKAIEYIATHYSSNIRELEGALTRAVAYVSISGLTMSVENIAPILKPTNEKVAAAPETIVAVVSDALKVSLEDLLGNSRRREISFARQIAMYLMRQHTDLSLPRIGDRFGGKDHTTVMYSCEKISQLQKKDRKITQMLSELSDRINFATLHKN
ncbi:MAG: chromosomal replication initiator protein DnaA [Prochloraceae cyanobacterium]|nr:chromosomal replication initiator protein DnaA [Prochloraceae cyanobacterium]